MITIWCTNKIRRPRNDVQDASKYTLVRSILLDIVWRYDEFGRKRGSTVKCMIEQNILMIGMLSLENTDLELIDWGIKLPICTIWYKAKGHCVWRYRKHECVLDSAMSPM